MKKTIKIIIFIFVLSLLIPVSNLIFNANHLVWADQINLKESNVVNKEIKNLNSQINDQKHNLKNLQDKQKKYSESIKKKQAERTSLKNQMAILDNRLAKSELDIEMAQTDIERTKLEIKKINIQINNKNTYIKNKKEKIGAILRLLYKKNNTNALEILLLNNSLSDFLNQTKNLEDLDSNLKKNVDILKKSKMDLEREKENLDKQNKSLSLYKKQLEDKKTNLASEQQTKIYILGQVNSSEREYQRLFAATKREQEKAAAEITSMEKIVRAKLAKLHGKKLKFNDSGFIWPVPSKKITTYFHDPNYPFRKFFEHPGIDIRAAQGTAIKAAASGYVARAKDNGMGYSYIMLIHGNNFSTVYGHVSKILVKADEYVVQGQTIGLSGGMPGTHGAGRLTTGPHLHFEIRLKGIPVDPLTYMPE